MLYVFDAYSLDAKRYELRRGAEVIPLQPQVLGVLHYLIENRHRIVSKSDLIAAVWNGRTVSDSTLDSRISMLRHAIADGGKTQRFVRSFPRKGYRFVADVDVIHDAADDRTLAPLRSRPSIVVLPFTNLSGNRDQDRFIDGTVDDIVTALTQFRQLSVMPRSTSLSYRGDTADIARIAKELDVRYVLDGTLRREGLRTRLNVVLVDCKTGANLWASRYDGDGKSELDFQEGVTARLVGAVVPRLEQAEFEHQRRVPQSESDAYSYTVRGTKSLYQWTHSGIDAALGQFRKAIELDPEFAPAYGMAAYCYVQRQSYGWIEDRPREMREAARLAQQAAELGKDDALALAKAAHAIAAVGEDIESGLAFVEQAIRLNPYLATAWYARGWIMLFLGRPDAAIGDLERAQRLGPFDPLVFKSQAAMAYAHFFQGRYADALTAAESALRARPNYLTGLRIAATSSALGGRPAQARQLIARMRELDPALRVSGLDRLLPFRRAADFDRWADALHRSGLPD